MATTSSVTTSISAQIESLVQTYKTSLSKPVTTLQNRKTTLTARINALSEMKTKLYSLYSISSSLSDTNSSKINAFLATSSDPTVVTATATNAATVVNHTLLVTQLAKADTLLSNQVVSADTSVVSAEGAGTKTFSLTVGSQTKEISVTLESGDSNKTVISKIAIAVNAAGLSVSASVISDTSTTSRLTFTSKSTGSDSTISMSDTAGTLLDNIGLTDSVIAARTVSGATGAGYVVSLIDGLNAKFKLDSVDIVRQSNTVSDVLTGVTFKLRGTQDAADTPTTLTIESDTTTIKSNLQSFMDAYNTALTQITSKIAVNPSNNSREIFAGDQMFINLRIDLRSIAASVISGSSATRLADLGIAIADDGTLSFSNTSKLEAAVANNATDVMAFFNGTNGIATRLKTLLDNFVSTGGRLDSSKDLANSQIKTLTTRVTRLNDQINTKANAYRNDYIKLYNTYQELASQQAMIDSILSISS
jgi:flagellar hook-associated protein 2